MCACICVRVCLCVSLLLPAFSLQSLMNHWNMFFTVKWILSPLSLSRYTILYLWTLLHFYVCGTHLLFYLKFSAFLVFHEVWPLILWSLLLFNSNNKYCYITSFLKGFVILPHALFLPVCSVESQCVDLIFFQNHPIKSIFGLPFNSYIQVKLMFMRKGSKQWVVGYPGI